VFTISSLRAGILGSKRLEDRDDTIRLPHPVQVFIDESLARLECQEIAPEAHEIPSNGDRSATQLREDSLEGGDPRWLVPVQRRYAEEERTLPLSPADTDETIGGITVSFRGCGRVRA